MKRIFILPLLILALLISGCSSDQPVAAVEEISVDSSEAVVEEAAPAAVNQAAAGPITIDSYLTTDYENATSPNNQLSLGTLKLAESDQAISLEQAQILLPLWQASKALEDSTTIAPQEVAAVQSQIAATMTIAQLQTIAAMQLTIDDLAVFYESIGIIMPTNDENSAQGGGGAGSDLTEEERAARQATMQASGSGGAGGSTGRERKTIITDEVINFLSTLITNGG